MGLSNFGQDPNASNNSGPGHLVPAGGNPSPTGPGSPLDEVVRDMLIDYNDRFKDADPTLYRDEVIDRTIAALISKTKPNALLVGPAGVGKTRIAEDIARRLATQDSSIPPQLSGASLYELQLSSLVAGTMYRGMLEQKLKMLIEWAQDPTNKAILFIDEIHLLGSGNSEAYNEIAQTLKPALARGSMRVIGATTTTEARGIDDDPALARRFSRIVVDELTSTQTFEVLQSAAASYTKHYHQEVTLTDPVLAYVVEAADEFNRSGHRPDSALTLLDRSMADMSMKLAKLRTAMGDMAPRSVSLSNRSVESMAKNMLSGGKPTPRLNIAQLSTSLHDALQGQDDALALITDRLSREALSLFPRTKPLAWMFAGPSGVGKTQTVKVLAEQMTGQEPIVLNMTEFAESHTVSRIVGSPPGYVGSTSNRELPFDSMESNPHRVILLDEFEKAHLNVQRLFMQAIDEGYLTMARGQRIDFSRALIVSTTNAAREALSQRSVGFGSGAPQPLSHRSVTAALNQHFEPELLGRFGLVVGYNAIDESAYERIVAAHYQRLRESIVASNTRHDAALPATMPVDAITMLREQSYEPSLGARPAQRAVRLWIEDTIISANHAATVPAIPIVN